METNPALQLHSPGKLPGSTLPFAKSQESHWSIPGLEQDKQVEWQEVQTTLSGVSCAWLSMHGQLFTASSFLLLALRKAASPQESHTTLSPTDS